MMEKLSSLWLRFMPTFVSPATSIRRGTNDRVRPRAHLCQPESTGRICDSFLRVFSRSLDRAGPALRGESSPPSLVSERPPHCGGKPPQVQTKPPRPPQQFGACRARRFRALRRCGRAVGAPGAPAPWRRSRVSTVGTAARGRTPAGRLGAGRVQAQGKRLGCGGSRPSRRRENGQVAARGVGPRLAAESRFARRCAHPSGPWVRGKRGPIDQGGGGRDSGRDGSSRPPRRRRRRGREPARRAECRRGRASDPGQIRCFDAGTRSTPICAA